MAQWSTFYRLQSERLSRVAADRRLRPEQIADLVQEVWAETVEHWDSFRGRHGAPRLLSWSRRVMHCKTVDAIRRLNRQQNGSLHAHAAKLIDPKAPASADVAEERERREWLTVRLEELRAEDPVNGRLLCEHFLEERTTQELADETGLSVHAIHCRISRTLEKLRRQVSRRPSDGGASP
jgi:RNA polymerase sigma factor (sigma-70 family)